MYSAIFHVPSFPSQPSRGSLDTAPYPTTDKIVGSWYITHTTSPVWKDKRNVVVTYAALASASNAARPQLDDLITYQSLSSRKSQTMRGIDTPSAAGSGSWTWRGNGWLKFVTSQWEIVGHDDLPNSEDEGGWIAVFAQKSVFTPAVLNVCTRSKGGLESGRLEELKVALKDSGHEELGKLADGLYRVLHE